MTAFPYSSGPAVGQYVPGAVLSQMAGQYAPLASGVPYQPLTGFEGLPFGDNPIMQILGPMVLGPLMQKVGMAPFGLHDRNVYDVMQNQQFYKMQQQVQQAAAQEDRRSWERTMQGMAAIAGTPWGADQVAAARSLSSGMAMASPMLQQMFPDVLDEMAGPRGSAAVMAGRMMLAGRYRLDPVTGRLGQDASTTEFAQRQLFRELYSGGADDVSQVYGIGAGQVGQLYEQLGARGLLAGPAMGPRDTVRKLARENESFIREAAGRQGLAVPTGRLGDLSGAEVDTLLQDSQVADKLRSFDTSRVKGTLQNYLAAVNAVKDIFGEAGQPNAPMAQILGALDALTNNAIGQVNPGQLASMVRQTQQLANMSGVGIDAALIMQQHAAGRLGQMGLPAIFAAQANQGAMAWGAGYRASGLGAAPAWGAFNSDQLQQLDLNLRANAAGSAMAIRAGTAIRMSDAMGGFEAGGSAAAYVAALKAAATTGVEEWVDPVTGRSRSVNLGKGEFFSLMTNARLAGGQPSPLTAGELEVALGQRQPAMEQVYRHGLIDVVRRGQLQSDYKPFLAANLQSFVRSAFQGAGASRADATDAVSNEAVTAAVSGIMGMAPEDFNDDERRRIEIARIFKKEFGGGAAGAAAVGARGEKFYLQQAESFFGEWGRLQGRSRDFSFLGTAPQNAYRLFNPAVAGRGMLIQQQARIEANIREAMSPMNQGGGSLRRVVGYLQQIDPNNPNAGNLLQLASAAAGGVSQADIMARLVPSQRNIDNQILYLKDLQARHARATDPVERQELATRIDDWVVRLKATTAAHMQTLAAVGVVPGTNVMDPAIVSAAVNAGVDADKMLAQLAGVPGTPDEVWASPSGEAFSTAALRRGTGALDVAAGILDSEASVSQLGLAGIEHATAINAAGQELRALAQQFTNGDMQKLVSGKFTTPDVNLKVQAFLATQQRALVGIQGLQAKGDQAWGDLGVMARSLGLPEADVRKASSLGRGDKLALLGATTTEARAAAAKKIAERLGGGITADELVRAGGVFDALEARRVGATKWERTSDPEQLAQLMKAYGVNDIDITNQAVQETARAMMGSPAGEGFGRALMESQLALAARGKQGLGAAAAGMADGAVVSKMFSEYDEAKKPGGDLRKFREKYALGDVELAEFERQKALQESTGFSKFGTGGDVRTTASLKDAAAQFDKALRGGQMEPRVQAEFKDGLKVQITGGKITIEKDGTATVDISGTHTNSAGVGHNTVV